MQKEELIRIIEEKETKIQDLSTRLQTLDEKYFTLHFQFSQMQRLIYGSKRDRFISSDPVPGQSVLFGDLQNKGENTSESLVNKEQISYTRKRHTPASNPPSRQPIAEHLRREEITIEPNEDITGMSKIGEEITEVLHYKKPELYVKKYIRPKYVLRGNENKGVQIGELPGFPLPKSIIGSSLLAYLMISKYVDHLPIYRLISMFKRDGVTFSESTVCDWIKSGAKLLEPLYQVLVDLVKKGNYLQVDETTIAVLDRTKKGKTHRGYYWQYHDPVRGLVLFEYSPGRSQIVPLSLLNGFKGVLQSDGYNVYEVFEKKKEITLAGCMAHARRHFAEALDNHPQFAGYALAEIKKLYQVEEEARIGKMSNEQRQQKRMLESKPVLDAMKIWMKETVAKVLPKSLIGKAIVYSLSRWEKLCKYITDGKIEIDNNLVENKMRPIAIGRKNYMFAGSHEAAQRSAMFYSFCAMCQRHNINPPEWFENVLNRIQEHSIQDLEELLPHRWKPITQPTTPVPLI